VAWYYGQSPLIVDDWYTGDVDSWYNEAIKLEKEKIKASKK
jgi:hypothetical protein